MAITDSSVAVVIDGTAAVGVQRVVMVARSKIGSGRVAGRRGDGGGGSGGSSECVRGLDNVTDEVKRHFVFPVTVIIEDIIRNKRILSTRRRS